MELDSFKRSVEELRADLDSRINALESKLNSATDIPESKTELLAAANQALNRHDYTRARRLFRTFLSRYPDDENGPEVRFKVGLSLYNEQDYRSALGEFNWIRKNAAKSDVIHDTLYYLGLGLAKTGECKKAITYFEFLASRKSTAPKGHKDKALKQVEQIRKSAAELCTDGESAQPVAGDQK